MNTIGSHQENTLPSTSLGVLLYLRALLPSCSSCGEPLLACSHARMPWWLASLRACCFLCKVSSLLTHLLFLVRKRPDLGWAFFLLIGSAIGFLAFAGGSHGKRHASFLLLLRDCSSGLRACCACEPFWPLVLPLLVRPWSSCLERSNYQREELLAQACACLPLPLKLPRLARWNRRPSVTV